MLNLPPNWFVMRKMLEKLDNVAFSNDDIHLNDIDFNYVIFVSDSMIPNAIDFYNINTGDDNFDEDDPETIIHVSFMAWCKICEKIKACIKEISEELRPLSWHPKRWKS